MFDQKSSPQVAVVTGASAGVGRAVAREFGSRGFKVGLLARGQEGLEAAKREIEELGGQALVVPTDVSDAKQVDEAAARIERELGPIDIWVNDAMVSVFSPIKEMTPEDFRRVTEVTYLGYVHGTLSALKRMQARDHGVILQVGSALAYRSIPLQSAYCAAKHAIHGFSESLRTELLHDKSQVKVCEVNLPAVNTPQFDWSKSRMPRRPQPVPPIFQPELIARAIVHSALHPRRRVDLGYPTIKAVIAEKIMPALADWYLSRNGFDSQQTQEAANPERPNDLYHPVPGDHGAHGRFDARAKNFSLAIWANLHRKELFAAGALVLGLGTLFGAARKTRLIPWPLQSS